MARVLISDKMSPRAAEIFRARGIEVDEKTGLDPAALAEAIGGYDGLAIRSSTKASKELLARADGLRVIGRAGIGVDNVDVPAATARGIVVMNTPFGNSITTAEHAIAMMMALARQIPAADRSTQAGKWEKSRFMGTELCGKTLGVIGCGNIGAIVANRALGLSMKVIAFDPFLSHERADALGIEKVDLDTLLGRSDVITLHTPMTDQTRGIIDAAALAKCRRGVRIVNCARGGLVVEADLAAALDSGHVAGAAFDVFVEEPAKANVLFGRDNVVATPHLGASTEEAQENVAIQVAEQMADYLLTGAVTNAVNMPAVSAEDAPRLMPYMRLAEQLGSFAGQLTETGLRKIHIEYQGAAAGLNTRPVTAALLAGFFRPLMESVNMVNAPEVARQRNVQVTESKSDTAEDYNTLVRLTVTTERRERAVAGTLIGGDKPRVVNIKGIAVEAELAGHMIYVANEDKPGLVGRLGTMIGDCGINIGTFHLGRASVGGDAIALVAVDQPLPEGCLAAIGRLEHVTQARQLFF
ncbi:MAG: phosphoglycerate dehydrogenase [Alphaproteobacteria bacterium]